MKGKLLYFLISESGEQIYSADNIVLIGQIKTKYRYKFEKIIEDEFLKNVKKIDSENEMNKSSKKSKKNKKTQDIRPYHYKWEYVFKFEESTLILSYGLNILSENEVKIEFNPNKTLCKELMQLVFIVNFFCESLILTDMDLAIDIPIKKRHVHPNYSGKRKKIKYDTANPDETEYIGVKGLKTKDMSCRLYDKAKEVGLKDTDLTRIEATIYDKDGFRNVEELIKHIMDKWPGIDIYYPAELNDETYIDDKFYRKYREFIKGASLAYDPGYYLKHNCKDLSKHLIKKMLEYIKLQPFKPDEEAVRTLLIEYTDQFQIWAENSIYDLIPDFDEKYGSIPDYEIYSEDEVVLVNPDTGEVFGNTLNQYSIKELYQIKNKAEIELNRRNTNLITGEV